jgi:quercetin dioxygenase-like cupin family protein
MSVKNIRDVEGLVVNAGDKTTIQILVSVQEGPNFAMRLFVMEPGGGMPEHTNAVEHEQYILKGHPKIGIGDETFDVGRGEVIFIPEGVPHWYKNTGEENFEFLCIIPNKPDTIKIVGKAC